MRALIIDSIILAALVTSAVVATGKPERKDDTPKKPPAVPAIAGPCIFGDLTQDGRKIQIDGHASWYVERGEIRADGSLLLFWIRRSDGKIAPGLYQLHADGSITGRWAWGTDLVQDKDGNLSGFTNAETVRAAAKFD